MDRSGEEGFPPVGRRVGKSSFRMQKVLSKICSWMAAPLEAPPEEVVEENHDLW